MVFPHLCETFCSVGMQYDDIRPSGTAILEDFENLIVNAIEGMKVKGEDVRGMVPLMSPEATLKNWTATIYSYYFSSFIIMNQTLSFYLCPRVKSTFYVLAYFLMK